MYKDIIQEMHDTALASGILFAKNYGGPGKRVLDIGGKDVNGSLRQPFVDFGMEYICVDLEPHDSVDVVIKPNERLPFETGSIDLVVSTSCFEHDPCFWITFREMTRVVKKGGFIYVNAPSNGPYHNYPVDNWRFYTDAGQALAFWSGYQFANEVVYPAKVVESFHIMPKTDIWIDYVCVWERVEERETEIFNRAAFYMGILENDLRINSYLTEKRMTDK